MVIATIRSYNMPTLMTDPRSGGVKKSSGVNVLPIVAETWKEVRDDTNPSVDWMIATYDDLYMNNVTVVKKGWGGMPVCSNYLVEYEPSFGGVRLTNGKFVTFLYADGISAIQKGRATMHKNGVLNVLEGALCDIDMKPGMTEEEAMLSMNTNVRTNLSESYPNLELTPIVKEKTSLEIENPRKKNTMIITHPFEDESSFIHNMTPSPISDAADVSPEKFVRYDDIRDVRDPAMLPLGVDPLNREMSLSDSEFTEVFGIDKHTFMELPEWKRMRKKQETLLF